MLGEIDGIDVLLQQLAVSMTTLCHNPRVTTYIIAGLLEPFDRQPFWFE